MHISLQVQSFEIVQFTIPMLCRPESLSPVHVSGYCNRWFMRPRPSFAMYTWSFGFFAFFSSDARQIPLILCNKLGHVPVPYISTLKP
ncbi:hypothetical protein ABKN59_005607 [Abortiporus biennis]